MVRLPQHISAHKMNGYRKFPWGGEPWQSKSVIKESIKLHRKFPKGRARIQTNRMGMEDWYFLECHLACRTGGLAGSSAILVRAREAQGARAHTSIALEPANPPVLQAKCRLEYVTICLEVACVTGYLEETVCSQWATSNNFIRGPHLTMLYCYTFL